MIDLRLPTREFLSIKQNKNLLSLCMTKVQLPSSHSSVSWYFSIYYSILIIVLVNSTIKITGNLFLRRCVHFAFFMLGETILHGRKMKVLGEIKYFHAFSHLCSDFPAFHFAECKQQHHEKRKQISTLCLLCPYLSTTVHWKVRRSRIYCIKQKIVFNIFHAKRRHIHTCPGLEKSVGW